MILIALDILIILAGMTVLGLGLWSLIGIAIRWDMDATDAAALDAEADAAPRRFPQP